MQAGFRHVLHRSDDVSIRVVNEFVVLTVEKDMRESSGGNVKAAAKVGALIAERAKAKGIERVAFDRSGFKYHGRVKALADAAREGGLEF